MVIHIKANFKTKWKTDGDNTTTPPGKNTLVILSTTKSTAMDDITSCQEHSMKEIGAVDSSMELAS